MAIRSQYADRIVITRVEGRPTDVSLYNTEGDRIARLPCTAVESRAEAQGASVYQFEVDGRRVREVNGA